MQSLRLGAQQARVLVPRLLQLLMLDAAGVELVGKHISAQVGYIPQNRGVFDLEVLFLH